jgi:peptidoglycan/LPS O-acetylase OafA/YrhL
LYFAVSELFAGGLFWYVTYTPNILYFVKKEWGGMLSHFWSLGVEEQFYLLWPLLILLVHQAWQKFAIISVIFLSIVFKIFFFDISGDFFTFHDALPVSCFDAFGIGALLAYLNVKGQIGNRGQLERVNFTVVFIALSSMSFVVYVTGISFLFGILISLISFLLIWKSLLGFQSVVGALLNNKVFIYLGKISYGLYIYHNLVPWVFRCLRGTENKFPLPFLPVFEMDFLNIPSLLFICQFVFLVFIASMSWFFLEKPFIGLKRFYQ